jgi:hypothetical protein
MLRGMSTGPDGDRAGPAGDDPESLHLLLDGLVDDAGLFPPASLAMTDALEAHLRNRSGRYGPLLGRFLAPASRLPELVGVLDGRVAADDDVLLGLLCDTGLEGLTAALDIVASEPRLVLSLVEFPLPVDAPDLAAEAGRVVEALPDVEGYVEVPRVQGWREPLAVLADSAYGAKLRTGGTTAAAFPSEAEVAAFVEACVYDELPFKCTAGLHHAVRHTDPNTGFEHHGFLNVLLATHAAVQGAGLAPVEQLLAVRDGTALARRLDELDPTDMVVTRSFFVAFGSCSFDEPLDDVLSLGVIPKE